MWRGGSTGSPQGGLRQRWWRLSVLVVGFAAVFVLVAGAGLGGLVAAHQLSVGLLIVTLAGMVIFAVSVAVFYRWMVRPLVRLSRTVQKAAAEGVARVPLAISGPVEVVSLAREINRMAEVIQASAREKSWLAAIVESTADAVIGKTLDGVITSWNPGAERQYGYRADEVIGQSVSVIIPPGCDGELQPVLERVRRGEAVSRLETRRRRKDGMLLDVSLSVSPVRDAAGAVVGAATVARDISDGVRSQAERKALERRLRQSERLESLGQLAGGIAHDFNNLLAVISSYATFIAEQATGDAAVEADVAQIQEAAGQAARITGQLLIVAGRDQRKAEVIDLNELVASAGELLGTATGAGVELRVRPGAGLPGVRVDRGQAEQVLINLSVNARDAMPGGGTLTIRTRAVDLGEDEARLRPGTCAGRYVELAVSDTGQGMSEDVAARIFDPFFSTKPAGRGTGLGLATVHSVVSRAGGIIGVDSQVGSGTVFRILFPAVTLAPAGARPLVQLAQGTGQVILVVDDEPSVLALTIRILRNNGYTALAAGTYEEALSLASAQDFQLLLSDSVMPRMSGAALAKRIVAIKPRVRVMFMSGHNIELLRQQASGGPAWYIQKPFTPQVLLESVKSALGDEPPP